MSLWAGLGWDAFHWAENDSIRHLSDYDIQLRLNDPDRARFEEMKGIQVANAVCFGVATLLTGYNAAVVISRYKVMA